MIPSNTSFDDKNASLVKDMPVHVLEIEGYSRAFSTQKTGMPGHSAWVVEVSPQSQSVNDLEGGSSLGDLQVEVLDRGLAITSDLATFTFKGRLATLKTGFTGMDYADFLTVFTGVVNDVQCGNAANSYVFSCQDTARLAKAVIYTEGDDGQPTDNDHPKTVLGNPLDICESILLDYLGWADHDVDLDRLHAYRDQLFGGMSMEFKITSPPEAKNFIEQELFKPLGLYGWTDRLGRFTVSSLQPLPDELDSVFSITPNNMVGLPQTDTVDVVNVVSYRFDHDDDKFMSESVQQYAESLDLYDVQGQTVIESMGVRSGFQGYSLAGMVARAIFSRYGLQNPKLSTTVFWDAVRLEIGDVVDITHPLVPDRQTGVMGMDGHKFIVLDLTRDFKQGTVELVLCDANKIEDFNAHRIAPDAVAAWPTATVPEKDCYLFVGDSTGKQSDGTDNGRLG